MPYTVLIPQDVPTEAKTLLQSMGCTLRMGSSHREEDIIKEIVDCDALVARTAPLTRAIMQAGQKLKIIARYGVGVDNIDLQAAEELGIWVANTPEANSTTVAEHGIMMMMACAKDFVDSCVETRKGNFNYRNSVIGIDLAGKKLGILGLGRIGRHMAKIAGAGLGMTVLGYDPYLQEGQIPAGITAVKEWDAIFQQADFISVNLPLSEKTSRCIGTREFSQMKPTAWFINCARGGVVAEEELIDALSTGKIAGAALDVFDPEPPNPDNPLLAMKNVIVTPHDASFTAESYVRMGEHMAKNIGDVMAGRAPSWPVNHPSQPKRQHF